MTRPPRILRFISAQLEDFAQNRLRAVVTLQLQPGVDCVGTAESAGAGDDLESFQCAAEATTEALQQAVCAGDDSLAVDGVSVVDILGRSIVFVAVSANFGGEVRELLGFCVIGADHARSVALAVLNATNRFLSVG